jgi:hypothetical protein
MSKSLTEVHSLKQLVDKGLGMIGSNMRRSLLFIPLLSLSEIISKKKAKLSIREKRLKLIHDMN